MAWREVLDRQTGFLIGVVFDDCDRSRQTTALCRFKSGVEFEADLKIVEHPEGRFIRPDGTRVDVFVLDLLQDSEITPPPISPRDPFGSVREALEKKAGGRFVGEGRDQLAGGSCLRISSTKSA